MSKLSSEINQKRKKRLIDVSDELKTNQGITNEMLAISIGITPESLSRIKSKSGNRNVTDSLIKSLCRNYSQYREEYLKGEDNFKTYTEYAEYVFNNSRQIKNPLDIPLSEMLDINKINYRLACNITNEEAKILSDSDAPMSKFNEIQDKIFQAGYILEKDDKSIQISFSELEELMYEISDYVGMRISRIIAQKSKQPIYMNSRSNDEIIEHQKDIEQIVKSGILGYL